MIFSKNFLTFVTVFAQVNFDTDASVTPPTQSQPHSPMLPRHPNPPHQPNHKPLAYAHPSHPSASLTLVGYTPAHPPPRQPTFHPPISPSLQPESDLPPRPQTHFPSSPPPLRPIHTLGTKLKVISTLRRTTTTTTTVMRKRSVF
jgi:hypothetical protein